MQKIINYEYFTVEQQDRQTYSNVYYTVWNGSKKLRLNGHDLELKYPALFLTDGVWDTSSGGKAFSMVQISSDDFCAIYGYDRKF